IDLPNTPQFPGSTLLRRDFRNPWISTVPLLSCVSWPNFEWPPHDGTILRYLHWYFASEILLKPRRDNPSTECVQKHRHLQLHVHWLQSLTTYSGSHSASSTLQRYRAFEEWP